MNYLFLFLIFLTGASGIAAQVFLLRELLINFNGNELTIGIILSNWVAAEGLGAFLGGRFNLSLRGRSEATDEAISENRDCFVAKTAPRNDAIVFIALQLAFFASLFYALYLSRVFKGLLGIGLGQGVGIGAVLFSFLILFAPAFCHGALFSLGCRMQALTEAGTASSVGRVYVWETLGTLAGGLLLAYFFIPRLDPFHSVFVIALFVFLLCIVVIAKRLEVKTPSLRTPNEVRGEAISVLRLLRPRQNSWRVLTMTALFFAVYLFFGWPLMGRLQDASLRRQWAGYGLLESANSIYGNITVCGQGEQRVFFYNGLPAVTAPDPDRQFTQDFGRLPLLFCGSPRKVLVIGAGAGGLIDQIEKFDLETIDYVELDPALILALKKYPTVLTQSELSDKRVRIKNLDGRLFMRVSTDLYDLILVGLSSPSDLSANRLFTSEFFALAKKRLAPGGIFAFWLPGSSAYLGRELAALNASIYAGLKINYAYTRAIPGDYYNIFLGAQSAAIRELSAQQVSQKLSLLGQERGSLLPGYLDYLLDPGRESALLKQLSRVRAQTNLDLRPYAVFQMLVYWSRKFFPMPPGLADVVEKLSLRVTGGALVLLFLLLSPLLRRAKFWQPAAYCILTTGFFGMLANLVLLFAFQLSYGYVFSMISIFIAVFMAGAAAGAFFASKWPQSLRASSTGYRHCEARSAEAIAEYSEIASSSRYNSSGLLAMTNGLLAMTNGLLAMTNGLLAMTIIEIAIISFSIFLGFFINGLSRPGPYLFQQFLFLFFASGLLMGAQFPLAAGLYAGKRGEAGRVSSLLYAADLAGGWIAGLLGGVILLPVLGLFDSCLLMAIFKATSLYWIFLQKKQKIA